MEPMTIMALANVAGSLLKSPDQQLIQPPGLAMPNAQPMGYQPPPISGMGGMGGAGGMGGPPFGGINHDLLEWIRMQQQNEAGGSAAASGSMGAAGAAAAHGDLVQRERPSGMEQAMAFLQSPAMQDMMGGGETPMLQPPGLMHPQLQGLLQPYAPPPVANPWAGLFGGAQ
jgi:hypothetical protein